MSLKHYISYTCFYPWQTLYTKDWDKVKATSYFMPGDAVPIKQCIQTTKVQSMVSIGKSCIFLSDHKSIYLIEGMTTW